MKVNTVTSNEEYVRLEIFEGRIPLDEAGAELIRLAQAQLEAERQRHSATIQALCNAEAELRNLGANGEPRSIRP